MATSKHNTECTAPKEDLSGQPFNDLVVQSYIGRSRWECLCKCGNTTTARTVELFSGHKKSCGCRHREYLLSSKGHTVHGLSNHPIYLRHRLMLNRCYNPRVPAFQWYGGRGITVCDRWRTSVENFYADMGDPPPGMSLERIDNDGNYEPGNCIWASAKHQARNRRTSHFVTYDDETHTIAAWAEKLHANANTFQARLQAGWSIERTLTTPTQEPSKRQRKIYGE
jgi:hypothetical protein